VSRAVRGALALRWLLLPAALGAVELGPGPAAAVLALLALLWLAARPPRRSALVGASTFALAAAVGFVGWISTGTGPRHDADPPTGALAAAYDVVWDDLEAAADFARSSIGRTLIGTTTTANGRSIQDLARDPEARLAAFEHLQELAGRPLFAGKALLLLDPDGEALAWAGEGLLHELDFDRLRGRRSSWARSYTAATLVALRPLAAEGRPGWVVVGRSDATDRLPFAAGFGAESYRWAPGEPAEAELRPGTIAIDRPQTPPIYLVPVPAKASGERLWRRLAEAVLSLGFALLALVHGSRRWLEGEPAPSLPAVALPTFAAAFALGRALALPIPSCLAVGITAAAAVWGLLAPPRPGRRYRGALAGGLGALVFAGLVWGFQRFYGVFEVTPALESGIEALALRLAGALGMLALIAHAGRFEHSGERIRGRLVWISAGFFLAAGAWLDFPSAAVPLFALGSAAAAAWLGGFGERRPPAALAPLLILAALGSAAIWGTVSRHELRQGLENRYLPAIAPPTGAELEGLDHELADFFGGFELGQIEPPGPGAIDTHDLAFNLWRRSPLAQRDGLSALVVDIMGGDEPSSFSLGLPLDENLDPIYDDERWALPSPSMWSEALIPGEALLRLDGRPWGLVRYWFLPRPGFRLPVSEIEELEVALLRGRPGRRHVDGLPPSVLYALYSPGGQVLASPWDEEPPLEEVLRLGSDVVSTPEGESWFWAREGEDGIEVLFLPRLGPLEGLEVQGSHALGALVLLALVALLILPALLPRTLLADWLRNTLRSYSKRLIVVYTVLLFLPLVALSLVLMQGFEERLRGEQMIQGKEALESARTFLGDHLLDLITRPGFDIATELDRELLDEISGLVHHQVNVYWNSRVYASSQQELFTSGLLPRRIPGEIFSRLALEGYEQRPRSQESGELVYFELYAPLKIPGVPASEERFFVSVPLLEQEKEAVRELASMRRQTLLVTTGLFILLLAVGSRLARSFTAPLMELVEGTKRIAAGATSLELAPRELELAALGAAIDEMARHIAEAREQLVHSQRLEAWAEMARIIAHEIKNPLTPIRLSTEHMRAVRETRPERFDEVFDRCTENILNQVEELRDIATEFSIYSRIPRAELKEADLVEMLEELVGGYRVASTAVEIDWRAEPEQIVTRFDRRLLGRAVRNLLENALRASGDRGKVEVAVELVGEEVVIRVADSGPGVKSENLGRIFEPYFSTHDAGTGLGLPITQRVAEEHGGEVVANNRPGGGLEVVITIPREVEDKRTEVDDSDG